MDPGPILQFLSGDFPHPHPLSRADPGRTRGVLLLRRLSRCDKHCCSPTIRYETAKLYSGSSWPSLSLCCRHCLSYSPSLCWLQIVSTSLSLPAQPTKLTTVPTTACLFFPFRLSFDVHRCSDSGRPLVKSPSNATTSRDHPFHPTDWSTTFASARRCATSLNPRHRPILEGLLFWV